MVVAVLALAFAGHLLIRQDRVWSAAVWVVIACYSAWLGVRRYRQWRRIGQVGGVDSGSD